MNTTRWKVRSYAAQRGVMMFEIANVLGISDAWFSKKLRADLPEEELKKIFDVIDNIAASHGMMESNV